MFTTLLILIGVLYVAGRKRTESTVGKLSDRPLSLDNILMGVERGWYKARTTKTSFGYAVYLSGTKADGEETTDIYPISEETYNELQKRGI